MRNIHGRRHRFLKLFTKCHQCNIVSTSKFLEGNQLWQEINRRAMDCYHASPRPCKPMHLHMTLITVPLKQYKNSIKFSQSNSPFVSFSVSLHYSSFSLFYILYLFRFCFRYIIFSILFLTISHYRAVSLSPSRAFSLCLLLHPISLSLYLYIVVPFTLSPSLTRSLSLSLSFSHSLSLSISLSIALSLALYLYLYISLYLSIFI